MGLVDLTKDASRFGVEVLEDGRIGAACHEFSEFRVWDLSGGGSRGTSLQAYSLMGTSKEIDCGPPSAE